MKRNRIIFLDIDGVMTSLKSRYCFSVNCFNALAKILTNTGADIVISSSWRHENVEKTVKSLTNSSKRIINGNPFPFPEKIIGVTPRIGHRGTEIACYLNSHPCDKYVILDDDTDMLDCQKESFFKINPDNGLTEEDADKIIEFLNK